MLKWSITNRPLCNVLVFTLITFSKYNGGLHSNIFTVFNSQFVRIIRKALFFEKFEPVSDEKEMGVHHSVYLGHFFERILGCNSL